MLFHAINIYIRQNFNTNSAAFLFQHGDDLLRRAIAKELSQRFLMVGNAVLLHQRDEIRRRVACQCGLSKVWVGGDKIFRTAMQIGEIAASAARDQDLLSYAFSPLQYHHAASTLARFNGAHEASCAAAENDYIKIVHKPCRPAGTP